MATAQRESPQHATISDAQQPPSSPRWELHLFDRWTLCGQDGQITLGLREQRLLAVLALYGPRSRSYVAGILWPDSTDARAMGNLRVAVWQVEHAVPGLVLHTRTRLALAEDVRLDVHEFLSAVRWVVGPDATFDKRQFGRAVAILQRGDLLPGWYDDWVLYERSRLAQLRLRGLESLAEQLVSVGDTRTALEAALAAVAIEPLRESAQRALIRIHIADGNYLDAVREYRSFRTRLAAEMDVSPSGQLESMIHPLLVSRRARVRTSTATA